MQRAVHDLGFQLLRDLVVNGLAAVAADDNFPGLPSFVLIVLVQ